MKVNNELGFESFERSNRIQCKELFHCTGWHKSDKVVENYVNEVKLIEWQKCND